MVCPLTARSTSIACGGAQAVDTQTGKQKHEVPEQSRHFVAFEFFSEVNSRNCKLRQLRRTPLEAHAGQQIVDFTLAADHIGSTLCLHHRAVQR